MKLAQLTLIAVIGIALLAGCSKKDKPAPPQANGTGAPTVEGLGQKAASLDGLTFVKGDAVTLKAGKVFVVEFWATWCPPCRTSIPHLTALQKQYKDKGVTVVGITNEEDVEAVKSFVTAQGDAMDYTVAVDTVGDTIKGYMTAFKQGGIPTAFIVDGKGQVAWVGHPLDGLDEELAKVVAE